MTNMHFFIGPEPVFTKRGSIVIRSVKANKAIFSQFAPLSQEERKQLRVSLHTTVNHPQLDIYD